MPTNIPSDNPTKSPTRMPTDIPTNVPTNVPTQDPTLKPTGEPILTSTIDPTEIPSQFPSQEPTRGFTSGECCHARENTDLYEVRCNNLGYTDTCLSRYHGIICQWFLDDCGLILTPDDQDGDNCACGLLNGIDGSRQQFTCQTNYDDRSQCEFYGCDWICE